MCLPHPPSARTINPAVFRRSYKTAGVGSRDRTGQKDDFTFFFDGKFLLFSLR